MQHEKEGLEGLLPESCAVGSKSPKASPRFPVLRLGLTPWSLLPPWICMTQETANTPHWNTRTCPLPDNTNLASGGKAGLSSLFLSSLMGSGHSHELSKRHGLKFVRSWLMQLDVFEKRQREVIIIHYLHEIFQRKKQRLPKKKRRAFWLPARQEGNRITFTFCRMLWERHHFK